MYKKNIALLIGSLNDRAGSERVVIDSANYLSSKGKRVYIFVCGDVKPKFKLCDTIKVISLTDSIPDTKIKQLFWYPIYIYNLIKACNKYEIKMVISHWTKLSICLPLLNNKIITWAHEHQNDKLLAGWLKCLKKLSYKNIDYLSVLNQSEFDSSLGKYNNNVGIIPGYVSHEFSLACEKLEKRKKLLFVGRLVDEKQPVLLLELLEKTNFMTNDWQLVMIGDGYLRSELENKIFNNFNNKVTLLSARELVEYYRECNSILITSKTEGFGLTIIEAMSQQCIPISFDCDYGPRNIITDSVDGFLCKNESDFINKVNLFFDMLPNELNQMRADALIKSNQYSQDKILTLWNTTLDGLFDEL